MELSTREEQITNLLAYGYTKKEIAAKLFIAYGTVESHVKNIYRKKGCNNLADVTRLVASEVTGVNIKKEIESRIEPIILLSIIILITLAFLLLNINKTTAYIEPVATIYFNL